MRQSMAFISGMASVIDLKWLQLFDADELQIVISGAHTDIEVDDWMRYTNVVGGKFTQLMKMISPGSARA